MPSKTQKIEISYKTVIFTVVFIIGLWFFYHIREILLALFISVVLMGALNPTVDRLEKWKFPRWLAILFIYIILLSALILALANLIPPLADQTGRLVQVMVDLVENFSFLGLSSEDVGNQLQGLLGELPSQIVKIAVSVFSNIIGLMAILMVTFYLLIEHKKLDDYLFLFFGMESKDRAKRIVDQIEKKLGGWVRAEIILMTVVGLLSYLGFKVLGLKFALPLAIIAGLLEVVPNIGPILSAVPAVVVGLVDAPITGLLVVAWAFIVQQLENNLIVPKIMQKSIGVNPLITILTLAVGFKLAGVMGTILAIPIYLALEVVFFEFVSSKKSKGE